MQHLDQHALATPARRARVSRRGFLAIGGLGVALTVAACNPTPSPTSWNFIADIQALEQSSGVTIGI